MFSTFVIIVTIIFMKWRILRVYSTDRVNWYITHNNYITFYNVYIARPG
jgi:hypothetical protein